MPEKISKSFGYKMAWIALPIDCNENTEKIVTDLMDDLKIQMPSKKDWEESINSIYDDSSSYGNINKIFISPPVAGWIFIISPVFFADDNHSINILNNLACFLSSKYGDTKVFGTHRVVEYHQWLWAKNGNILRSFAFLGESGKLLVDIGKPTEAERSLRFDLIDSLEWTPDEETVISIASQWSKNPQELDGQKYEGEAYLGKIDKSVLAEIVKNNKFEISWTDKTNQKPFLDHITKEEYLINHYRKRTASNVMRTYGYLNMGCINYLAGKTDEAVESLKNAIYIDDKNYYAKALLAKIYKNSKIKDITLERIIKSLSEKEQKIIDHYLFGFKLILADEDDQAIAHFERAAQIDPNSYFNYYIMSEVCVHRRNTKMAKEYSTRLVSHHSLDEGAYDVIATVFALNGEFENAEKTCKKMLEVNPDSFLYYLNMAAISNMRKEYKVAIDNCKKAISINSNIPESYVYLGSALISSGEIEEGIDNINKAIEMYPGCYVAYLTLGGYYFQKSDFVNAEKQTRKAIYYNPYEITAYHLLARILIEEGDYEIAQKCLNRSLDMKICLDDTYSYLGYLYYQQGNKKMASSYINNALEINKNHPFAKQINNMLLIKKLIIQGLIGILVIVFIIASYFLFFK